MIDVQKEDPLARIKEITGGKGVDVVLDCTAGAGTFPILLGVEALKRKAGTMVMQGEMAEFPNFPIGQDHGEVHHAEERARPQLQGVRAGARSSSPRSASRSRRSRRTRFGLKDVDLAIRSVGGHGVPDVIHASLMPWK